MPTRKTTPALMSKERLEEFNECQKSADALFPDYAISDKLDNEDCKKIAQRYRDQSRQQGVLTSHPLLIDLFFTKNGLAMAMQRLSSMLCRWPRPSEIMRTLRSEAVLASATATFVDIHNVSIIKAVLPITFKDMDGRRPPDFVGKLGANLIRLSADHGLIYAWLSRKGSQFVFKLWAFSSDNIKHAAEALIREQWLDADVVAQHMMKTFEMKMSDPVYEDDVDILKIITDVTIQQKKIQYDKQMTVYRALTSNLNPKAKEFVPKAKNAKGLNPKANEFVPKAKNAKGLNPNANEFIPKARKTTSPAAPARRGSLISINDIEVGSTTSTRRQSTKSASPDSVDLGLVSRASARSSRRPAGSARK